MMEELKSAAVAFKVLTLAMYGFAKCSDSSEKPGSSTG